MKRMIPSVLAISALLLAPVTLWADSDKEGSAQGTACAVEACPVSLQTKASTCSAGCEQACCANAQAKLTKVQYEVKDLACAACETKVKEALASLEGVGQAAACSKEKHVTVAYDAQKVKEKQLMAAIKKAGFNVTAETVELKVDGMTCGACSGKVSKALANLKGVQQQEVCHESGKAVVTFDPNSLSREKVLAAIDQTGFKIVQ